jgi:excinuclease UvrABC nuclease subunit
MGKGRWTTYLFSIDPWIIPHKPGVYVIYGDGQILYIGQALDVCKRISSYQINFSHYSNNGINTPWGRSQSVKIKISFSKKFGDWAMRELRLIKKLQPKENCVLSIKKRKGNG